MTNRTLIRLRHLNKRLKDLLDDPHPGLSTWHDALHTTLIDMAGFVVKDPMPMTRLSEEEEEENLD